MLSDYTVLCTKKSIYVGRLIWVIFLFIKALKTWIKLKLLEMGQHHFSTYTFSEDTEIIGNKVL